MATTPRRRNDFRHDLKGRVLPRYYAGARAISRNQRHIMGDGETRELALDALHEAAHAQHETLAHETIYIQDRGPIFWDLPKGAPLAVAAE